MFGLTGRLRASEIKAVTMVHPALGPSLGVAPYNKSGFKILVRLKNFK